MRMIWDSYLHFDQNTLNAALQVLEDFHYQTGFTINYDKTTVYRIGSLKNSDAKLYSQKPLKWSSTGINVLGIDITHNTQNTLHLNYNKLVTKATDIMKKWQYRSLSLKGKILVINTLIASMFVYRMTVLPRIPEIYVKKLDQAISEFLWNGHKPKNKLGAFALKQEIRRLKADRLSKKGCLSESDLDQNPTYRPCASTVSLQCVASSFA